MLMKLLSDEDKKHLLTLAKLLAMADKQLLWDGKTSEEFTSNTNLGALSIREDDQERELIAEIESAAGVTQAHSFGRSRTFDRSAQDLSHSESREAGVSGSGGHYRA
jgi:hypothetical protein